MCDVRCAQMIIRIVQSKGRKGHVVLPEEMLSFAAAMVEGPPNTL